MSNIAWWAHLPIPPIKSSISFFEQFASAQKTASDGKLSYTNTELHAGLCRATFHSITCCKSLLTKQECKSAVSGH